MSIKLNKQESLDLRRALAKFNKAIEEHKDKIDPRALPEKITYNQAKDIITTRKDYNSLMASLKKIENKNAFNVIKSNRNPNVMITNWELQFRGKQQTVITKRLEQEKAKLYRKRLKQAVTVKVGNIEEVRLPSPNEREQTIEKYLETPLIEKVINATEYYRRNEYLKDMMRLGFETFDYKKYEIYKQNYLHQFENYKNLDNYQTVVDYLQNLSAKDFFKLMERKDTTYNDFSVKYDHRLAQAEFNAFAKKLGIDIDDYDLADEEE